MLNYKRAGISEIPKNKCELLTPLIPVMYLLTILPLPNSNT
jgi:hypothetical protein